MKFVFVSYNYSPNFFSPDEWVERIKVYAGSLECLAKTNMVIRVEQINYTGQYLHKGIHYHFVDYGKKKLYFPWSLHRYIKSLEPDIVVVHGLHYPLQVIQLRFQLGREVKIIVQNHAEKPFTGIKKYLQRLADRYIDAYLFASRAMGAEWVKKGNLGSFKKIHEVMEVSSVFYLIDRTLARSQTKVNSSPVFLWVGRLNQNKDPLTVVKAFLRFAKFHPSARLYMIYHTDELLSEIKNLLREEVSDETRIVLIGKVPHDELLYWFNSADFIVSGSHYEGSGAALCEAMSCGCLPVVTDIFSFQMMTANGQCGLLYEPGNEQALLSSLMKVMELNMQEERTKTLKQFRDELSFETIADKIEKVAISLL